MKWHLKKFTKPYTYVAKSIKTNRWYIVHQYSQRGWVATPFSHCVSESPYNMFTGNGSKCYEELRPEEVYAFKENSELRRMMFTILKYGKVENE